MAALALPEGWAAYRDAEGREFYANTATGETSWQPPAIPAAQPYNPHETLGQPYVAQESPLQQQLAPAEPALPPGWGIYQDPEGRTYYANAATGETSWTPPAGAEQAPEPSPAIVAATEADAAAAPPQWSVDYAYALGAEGCESLVREKAVLLDKDVWYSVVATVEALNTGALVVEAGICVIYSRSKESYFLLWREDKDAEVWAELGLDESEEPCWSVDQACILCPPGSEHVFSGKAVLLDTMQFTSVMTTVDALNAGEISPDDGFCVMYSVSQQTYYLLWRYDKRDDALARLDMAIRPGA